MFFLKDKPSTLDKFCKTSWKCLYYTYGFTYGTIILWDKPWLWDVKSCWYGYPHYVVGLVKQVDLTERQIERWWRLRRAQDRPSTLDKFCETSWKCLYYTYSFTFGTIIFWDKPWLWDVKSCWYGYPHHSIDNGIWWYFSVSMAFYFSLTVTHFFETKRKDFWQMFAHHIITLTLMSMVWFSNFHRYGALVTVIHDCADIFLECAKSLKYAKYHKMYDCVFVVFLVTWVATRLVFYPRIVYSSIFELPGFIEMFPFIYVAHILQVALLCLHVFWSNIIFQAACSYVSAGKVVDDPRSSSGEASDSPINAENEIRQSSLH
ncbi:Ceramide synthase 6 [Pseudolycoriella hygida]|uniref:Ceramide synthase 6 n=1 Tax=Pseudolycoriella hygida TaxID=35572 RepID=A0A9Q0RV33_9DIPT|nr:Ceramide synthase 6 [Pseudolycoriella hygida]